VSHGFNDVFNPISGFVDSSDRQSSINDQIPVVFGATFAASLFANLIFGSRSQNSNTADCRCGIETGSRIVNGAAVTTINKYPWMVALVLPNLPIRLGRFCGGSLVGSKYVVTAAHCLYNPYPTPIQPEDLKVRIGDHDLSMEGETTIPEKTIEVAKITIHPDYSETPDNSLPFLIKDIAVLELAEEVDLTVYTPICLPRSGVTEQGTGSVYGWGSTGGTSLTDCAPATSFPDILQEAQMRVCTAQELQNPATGQSIIEDYQICYISETGSSAYRGDSGGPVSMKSNDQHILVGDTSFGAACILAGTMDPQASIFGRVSYFRTWLEDQMPDVKTCRNGFNADSALARSPSWARLAQEQAERARRKQEKQRKRERRKNKKGKNEKTEKFTKNN